MYSLHMLCPIEEIDSISVDLWEAGTLGIREVDAGGDVVKLVAAFETNELPQALAVKLRGFQSLWEEEEETDWVAETEAAWPARVIGEKLFLAPPWSAEPTPDNRQRIVHNPGMASGTGEHPCTQLALKALEQVVTPHCTVGDIGTGSAILAIAALRLGARNAFGMDIDSESLRVARENAALNRLAVPFALGSADCLASSSLDVVAANINASVLLALLDDLQRITKPGGTLILSGFQDYELATMQKAFRPRSILQEDGWCALISTCEPHASS